MIENLNYRIDGLQDSKLSEQDWWNNDEPLEDLANRTINQFQEDISGMDEELQEEALGRLVVTIAAIRVT